MRLLGWVGLALLAWLTFTHNTTVWTSELGLWGQAVEWAPQHPRPWINLGLAAFLGGDHTRATRAWEEASRVSQLPFRSRYERRYGFSAAETNLALLEAFGHHWPEVLVRLNRVLEDDPYFPEALRLRAYAKLQLGDCQGAQADWALYRGHSGIGDKGLLPAC